MVTTQFAEVVDVNEKTVATEFAEVVGINADMVATQFAEVVKLCYFNEASRISCNRYQKSYSSCR
jgi:hypothetical protein